MKFLNSVQNFKIGKKKTIPMLIFGGFVSIFLAAPLLVGAETTFDPGQAVETAINNNMVQWLLNIASWFVYYVIIYPNGYLSGIMIDLIVSVAGWSNFTTLPAIEQAWEVVLNLTNMVFIIFLLVIAFATVFKVESYSYKKLLPTLVIVAILVNFSKVICGVLIDASQIVMLAFLDPIRDTALQNLTMLFQLNNLFEFQGGVVDDLFKDTKDLSAEYLLAILVVAVMMAVMVLVLFVYLIVFLGRIVIFWIVTVLSPLAFVCAILPATKKYFSEWMETFSRYLIVGPLAMFFLWLAMYIVSGSFDTGGITAAIEANAELSDISSKAPTSLSKALNASTIANFIIATLLLVKGMEMAQKLATEFGDYIGKSKGVGEWFAKGGLGRELSKRVIKPAIGLAGRGAKRVGSAVGRGALTGGKYAGDQVLDSFYESTGVDLNLKRVWEKMRSESADIKRERELTGRAKARKYAESGDLKGWLGASDYMYRQYMPFLGEQQRSVFDAGARRRRAGDDHPNFEKAQANYQRLIKENGGLKEEEARLRKDFTDTNISDTDYLQKQGLKENMGLVAQSLADQTFNKDEANSKSMLQNYLGYLESKGDAAGATNVRNLQNGTGGVDAIKNGFDEFLAEQRSQLTGEMGVNRMGDDEFNSAMENILETSGIQGRLDENNKGLAFEKNAMGQFAPVIDYAAVQAQRSYMNDEMQKVDTDNEDDLIALYKSKMNSGDENGALAVMLQASKVGHSNEMTNALGLKANTKNLQLIFQSMINDEESKQWAKDNNLELLKRGDNEALGNIGNVDRQLAMSVADDYSRNAKGVGHWWAAEMVTNQHGKFSFRDKAEQEMRKYHEMDKAGLGNVMTKNRLAFGDYYTDDQGEEAWKFSESGLAAFANSVGSGMSKSMRDKRLNENLVHNIISNEKEWRKLKAAVKEQVKARPGQKDKIEECMRELKGYVAAAKKGGFKPGDITAKHKRIIDSI